MRIAIVGAGAIGGWIGTRLALRGHDIHVLARGETLRALSNGPWRLESGGETMEATVTAAADARELGTQDVVLITLKGPALPAVAPDLTPLIGPETIIVPMMNGIPWWFLLGGGGALGPTSLASIDPTGDIARALPFRNVLGSVVHASVAGIGPAHIAHKAGNRLILGEPGGGDSDRLRRLCALFEDAAFDVEASPRIRYEIWYKLWGNMTMNPISAITGATCDQLLDDPLISGFVLRVMAEAQRVGEGIGCAIAERGEDRNAVTRKLGAFKTSMLQDAEAGRPMEIDQLLFGPMEIARLIGVSTPDLDALAGLTRLFGRTKGLYPPV